MNTIEFLLYALNIGAPQYDYSDVQISVQFWNTYTNPAGSNNYDVFSDPVGSLQTVNLGAFDFSSPTSSGLADVTFTLPDPVTLTGSDFHGVSFHITDSEGDDNLTMVVTGGSDAPPYAVGSVQLGPSPEGGWFQNDGTHGAGATLTSAYNFADLANANAAGSDARHVDPSNSDPSQYNAIVLKLSNAPEPSTLPLLFGVATSVGVPFGIRRRRRIAA